MFRTPSAGRQTRHWGRQVLACQGGEAKRYELIGDDNLFECGSGDGCWCVILRPAEMLELEPGTLDAMHATLLLTHDEGA